MNNVWIAGTRYSGCYRNCNCGKLPH